MSLNQYFPPFLQKLNQYKIPYVTLVINLAVGMFSFLPFPGWQKMMTFLSSIGILLYAIGPVCTYGMRKLEPLRQRPFRLAGAAFVCCLSFYVCNLMLHWCGFTIIWKLYVMLILGLLTYCIYHKEWHAVKNRSLLWFFLYITTFLVISYLGPFGGIGILKFPYDLMLILPLSIFIFFLSQHCLSPGCEIYDINSSSSNKT